MQVEPRDGSVERQVIIACITDTEFLARVVPRVDLEPFRSKDTNLVYSWCRDHFSKYDRAPDRAIKTIFAQWAETNRDRDMHVRISRLLSSLSSEAGEGIKYTVDVAERYFNEIRLDRLKEELTVRLSRGGVEQALEGVKGFTPVNLKSAGGVNVLEDKEAQRKALEEKQNVLIRYPGAAGEFFGEEFSEDSFVGVMASAKGGKSYTLLDMAWRAMLQGRQVAYFQVGDLSLGQIMRRFHRRAAYRPIRAKTVQFPVSIMVPEGYRELAIVDFEEKVYEADISWKLAERAFEKACARTTGRIKLFYHPVKTVSIADVKATLDSLSVGGWNPKVIVIDYAGNLAAVDHRANPVEQVSHTWAMMRQLSELRKCCVITANQSNKESFSSWVLTRKHFADSKMILAHVTAFLGVNMTDEEKQSGVMRYNFIVRREDQFSESYCLVTAACLDVCNPCVVSCLPKRR